MSWKGRIGDWHDAPVPRNECDLYHLVEGMVGHNAPTGQWGIIMACLIRYSRLKRAVELGVHKGGTSVFIADAMRDMGGTLIMVDQEDCFEARDRLQRLGLNAPHSYFHKGRTSEVTYDGEPIDLLFIDAGHSYADVSGDWRRWTTFVRPGGWVFIDNATSHDDVATFVEVLTREPAFQAEWGCLMVQESYGMAIMKRRLR